MNIGLCIETIVYIVFIVSIVSIASMAPVSYRASMKIYNYLFLKRFMPSQMAARAKMAVMR